MSKDKDKELVLCIRRWAFERNLDAYIGGNQYIPFDFRRLKQEPWVLDGNEIDFIPRGECENDPRWLQIIPYIVVTANRYDQQMVLGYYRSKSSNESRLHGKLTIGVGGHINPGDVPFPEELGRKSEWPLLWPIVDCARRELAEEAGITENYDLNGCGWLIEDQTEVGKVHVGAVILACLGDFSSVVPGEELHDHVFYPMGEFRAISEQAELWTKILLSEPRFHDRDTFYNVVPIGTSAIERKV